MPLPRRVLRLVLPTVAACLLLGAFDADASIRRELDELLGLVESDDVVVEELTMTTRLVRYTVSIPVDSAKERKQVRYARLLLLLDGDRLHVYRTEGWPTARRRVDFAGSVTEHWIYDDKHITYVFQGDRLIETLRD